MPNLLSSPIATFAGHDFLFSSYRPQLADRWPATCSIVSPRWACLRWSGARLWARKGSLLPASSGWACPRAPPCPYQSDHSPVSASLSRGRASLDAPPPAYSHPPVASSESLAFELKWHSLYSDRPFLARASRFNFEPDHQWGFYPSERQPSESKARCCDFDLALKECRRKRCTAVQLQCNYRLFHLHGAQTGGLHCDRLLHCISTNLSFWLELPDLQTTSYNLKLAVSKSDF